MHSTNSQGAFHLIHTNAHGGPVRAVLLKGCVSMICLGASLTICSKVREVFFPRCLFELLFFLC